MQAVKMVLTTVPVLIAVGASVANAEDCPAGKQPCVGMGSHCGDNSCCDGMDTVCGSDSICSGMGTVCGAGSVCSGMGSRCGPRSTCSGLSSVCLDGSSTVPGGGFPTFPPMPTMGPMKPLPTVQARVVYNHGCDMDDACKDSDSVAQAGGHMFCCKKGQPGCAMQTAQEDDHLTATCTYGWEHTVTTFLFATPTKGRGVTTAFPVFFLAVACGAILVWYVAGPRAQAAVRLPENLLG